MDEGSSMNMDEGSAMHLEEETAMVEHTHVGEKKASINHKRRGTGLDRITNGLGVKVTIEIPEGMKRPVRPMQAAKFASEGGYVARGQMPLLPHFKEYKKQPKLMEDFIGKVAASFEMDTTLEVNQKGCTDVLQKVSKNRRHWIKSIPLTH